MKFIALMLAGLTLASCSRVGTGDIGILVRLDKTVDHKAITNSVEMTFLDSVLIVDGTQVRVLAENVKSKDIDGILFVDIDAQATYNTNPQGAIEFYMKTREIDCVVQNEGSGCIDVLGHRIVKQELINSIVKAFTKFKALDVNVNKAAIEKEVSQTLQEKLNSLYKNSFEITNVNINSAQLDPSVERVLQTQALLDSEKRLISSKLELQIQQSGLFDKELMDLKNTASKIGVSVSDLLKYKNDKERNKVLSELVKNNANTQLQIKE